MGMAVALGLVVALIVVPGVFPSVAPATAQGLEPPASKPSEQEPSSEPSSEPEEEKPSESTQPASRPPAFSPSGSGSGAGSDPSAPRPSESGASQPKPAAPSTSSPPPLGAVVYENALKDERVFKAGYCFGRKAFTQYVGEGFKLRVMGPCFLLLDEAWISVQANGVMVGDGEVALDFKVVDGLPRARVGLYVRSVNEQLIGAHVHPARGEASLFTLMGGKQTDLGYRANVGVKPHDWNRLALRVSGYNAWLLLNDEPVLHSGEVHADAGRVIVELIRDGNHEDEEEAAVVFRDLQLSALEGGEPGRAPTGP
jgi:hypothetical protein